MHKEVTQSAYLFTHILSCFFSFMQKTKMLIVRFLRKISTHECRELKMYYFHVPNRFLVYYVKCNVNVIIYVFLEILRGIDSISQIFYVHILFVNFIFILLQKTYNSCKFKHHFHCTVKIMCGQNQIYSQRFCQLKGAEFPIS